MEIIELKKEYLRRIIAVSLRYGNYSTLVLKASFCLDEIRDLVEELKDEFNLKCIIINDFDVNKIKSFYEKQPTEKEIEAFIPKFPTPIGNIKEIYFVNDITELSDNYFDDYAQNYRKHLKEQNKEFFDRIKYLTNNDKTASSCPNKEWAEYLLGSQDKLPELWVKISKTLLDPIIEQKETEARNERKNELNKMGIRHLHFYTDSGTDIRISLNPHSLWVCDPYSIGDETINNYNYPSYEVFTAPNCYSAEGRIVLTKKRHFYYNKEIESAIFDFEKGRIVSCNTNSKTFESIVSYKKNKMNRIGEIALVPQSTPLAQNGEYYASSLLDENTGCHFALGCAIPQCIGVDPEKLKLNGPRYYRYNTSDYHTDLVFGDSSIAVEAETRGKKKVLLMDRGEWKI